MPRILRGQKIAPGIHALPFAQC